MNPTNKQKNKKVWMMQNLIYLLTDTYTQKYVVRYAPAIESQKS